MQYVSPVRIVHEDPRIRLIAPLDSTAALECLYRNRAQLGRTQTRLGSGRLKDVSRARQECSATRQVSRFLADLATQVTIVQSDRILRRR